MFLQVSFIHFVHRGVSGEPPWQGEPPPDQADTPPDQGDPLGRRLQHTVNEWPVRILLECILVS